MSETCHIVATLVPRAGKFDDLTKHMENMCKNVYDKENGTCHRYAMHKSVDKDPPIIIMVETYENEAEADKHVKTDHFNDLVKTLTDEEILGEPPNIMKCKNLGGFWSR